jgi:hypothetical protein
MAKAKREPPSAVPLMLLPIAKQEMLDTLDAIALADVTWVFRQIEGRDITFIRNFLDKRTEPKVAQFEGSHPGGTLRVIFAWGKGCLWFIGAFVKTNNREGERFMRRILPRAEHVKDQGVPK